MISDKSDETPGRCHSDTGTVTVKLKLRGESATDSQVTSEVFVLPDWTGCFDVFGHTTFLIPCFFSDCLAIDPNHSVHKISMRLIIEVSL